MSVNYIPTRMIVLPAVASGEWRFQDEFQSGCQHVVDYHRGSDSFSGIDCADGDIYDEEQQIRRWLT